LRRRGGRVVPLLAYEVVLTPSGDLAWIESSHAGERRHDVEPGTTGFTRAKVDLLSLLPIDGLL